MGLLITKLRKVYCWVCEWKQFKIGDYLVKVTVARVWLCHALCTPGQRTAKTKKVHDRMTLLLLTFVNIYRLNNFSDRLQWIFNRFRFDRIVAMSLWSHLFGPPCISIISATSSSTAFFTPAHRCVPAHSIFGPFRFPLRSHAMAAAATTTASCCNADSERPHPCCHLANNFHSRQDIRRPYTDWLTGCIYSPQKLAQVFKNNTGRLPERHEYLSMLAAFTT